MAHFVNSAIVKILRIEKLVTVVAQELTKRPERTENQCVGGSGAKARTN
jgi:hypothetical protein